MKANHNPVILRMMKDNGLDAVTVSGYEILLALRTGFMGSQIFYNGVGKQRWEVEIAVVNSCYLNVDSLFDADLISQVAKEKQKVTQVSRRVFEFFFWCLDFFSAGIIEAQALNICKCSSFSQYRI